MKTKLIPVLFATLTTFLPFSTAFSQEAQWLTDYSKAVEQAKKEDKAILLDFTGSDWCGWCIKMKKDVLDTKEFTDYASKNLVLVEVDFPNKKTLPDEVKKQNEELKGKYDVGGFPTFVLVSKTGRKLGEQVGYLAGGPSAFIAQLNTFHKPAAKSGPAAGKGDFDKLFKKASPTPTP